MAYKDKERQKEYQRLWVAKRRQEWFADKSCTRCNSIDRLELDHIDRATKVSHNIWSWSQEKRDNEIKKCQVLCHDCHEDKSYREEPAGHQQLKHGGNTMYKKYKCRCNICLAWRKTVDNNWMKIKSF